LAFLVFNKHRIFIICTGKINPDIFIVLIPYINLIVLKIIFIVIAKLLKSYGNLNADGFEITTSFCFRKTPRDDILI